MVRKQVGSGLLFHLLLGLTLIVTFALPGGEAFTAAPLSSLGNRLSDLRPGYTQMVNQPYQVSDILSTYPAQAHHLTTQQIRSHCWLEGLIANFQRSNSQYYIDEYIDHLDTTAGAH